VSVDDPPTAPRPGQSVQHGPRALARCIKRLHLQGQRHAVAAAIRRKLGIAVRDINSGVAISNTQAPLSAPACRGHSVLVGAVVCASATCTGPSGASAQPLAGCGHPSGHQNRRIGTARPRLPHLVTGSAPVGITTLACGQSVASGIRSHNRQSRHLLPPPSKDFQPT